MDTSDAETQNDIFRTFRLRRSPEGMAWIEGVDLDLGVMLRWTQAQALFSRLFGNEFDDIGEDATFPILADIARGYSFVRLPRDGTLRLLDELAKAESVVGRDTRALMAIRLIRFAATEAMTCSADLESIPD